MNSQLRTHRRRQRHRIRLPLWALAVLAGLTLIFLSWTAVWLFRTVQQAVAHWEVTDPPEFAVDREEPGALNLDGPFLAPTPLGVSGGFEALDGESAPRWSGIERINVLLLGIDQRCDESGPTRTDSIMVVTLDPVTPSAAALSLPRDLWIEIPNFGVDRINRAHYLGEAYEYPGGGSGLAVDTVAATLGVPIHYYIEVNFDAFVDFIDLIGGIDVNVEETINDPTYPDRCYGYDPFRLTAGSHTLDGATALKYVRTRSTLGGDVDRAQRQQEVGMALRDQVLNTGQLPRLIAQAPQLWRTFQRNVRTNLSPEEAIQLGLLAQDISRDNIHLAVIDYDYVYAETTPDGQQVLVPLRDNIRALRNELFAPPAIPTPAIDHLPEKMVTEAARVVVYNGTPRFGLAGATQAFLAGYDVNVTGIGNADAATYRATQIVDFGSHPNTTLFLSQLMGVPPLNISNGTDPDGDYDVLIILGNDWEVPTP